MDFPLFLCHLELLDTVVKGALTNTGGEGNVLVHLCSINLVNHQLTPNGDLPSGGNSQCFGAFGVGYPYQGYLLLPCAGPCLQSNTKRYFSETKLMSAYELQIN